MRKRSLKNEKRTAYSLSAGCTGITKPSHTLTVSWLHPNTRSTDEASCERNRWDIIVCVIVCVVKRGWANTFSFDGGDCVHERSAFTLSLRVEGPSYLPVPWALPLPGCRGIIRRRFVQRTTRLARCPSGGCSENTIGHFGRSTDQLSQIVWTLSDDFCSVSISALTDSQSHVCFLRD